MTMERRPPQSRSLWLPSGPGMAATEQAQRSEAWKGWRDHEETPEMGAGSQPGGQAGLTEARRGAAFGPESPCYCCQFREIWGRRGVGQPRRAQAVACSPKMPEGGLGGMELGEFGLSGCDSQWGGLLPSLRTNPNPAPCGRGLEARAGSSILGTAPGLLGLPMSPSPCHPAPQGATVILS